MALTVPGQGVPHKRAFDADLTAAAAGSLSAAATSAESSWETAQAALIADANRNFGNENNAS
jgi:hypothetical protein